MAGEALALAALLGTALKLDGRLTVQTKGDGPLDLVTADYYGADEDGAAARRARLRPAGCGRVSPRWTDQDFAALAGKGALAITIEPSVGGQTYQGIVELSPDGIARLGRNLFRPVRAIAHRDPPGGRAAVMWRATSSRTGAPAG